MSYADEETGARRLATKVGLVAHKSRWRKYSCDNLGDFMVTDPSTGFPIRRPRAGRDRVPELFSSICSDYMLPTSRVATINTQIIANTLRNIVGRCGTVRDVAWG
jgi:hypothetical protein